MRMVRMKIRKVVRRKVLEGVCPACCILLYPKLDGEDENLKKKKRFFCNFGFGWRLLGWPCCICLAFLQCVFSNVIRNENQKSCQKKRFSATLAFDGACLDGHAAYV